MAYAIVNQYKDKGQLRITKVYGPYETRKEAEDYNESQFPSPELNQIVTMFDPVNL